MSLLSVAELQSEVETDLSDETLARLIEAVERDITEYVGPPSAYKVEFAPGGAAVIELPVQAQQFGAITEYEGSEDAPIKTGLASDDYELSSDGWEVIRLSTGTNPRSAWASRTAMIIVPELDVARRKSVAVQLARLEIEHSPYGSERIGDWSAVSKELRKERVQIMRRLDNAVV